LEFRILMKRLITALAHWFSGLTYPRKFNVIALIFLLPILAFFPLIRNQTDRIDRYGTHELFGTLYLRPLWRLTDTVHQHQLVSLQYLDGEVEFSRVEQAQRLVDAEFDAYEFTQRQEILSEEFRTEEGRLKSLWIALKNSIKNGSREDVLSQHSQLLGELSALVTRVGDFSNLILDPDLDTYYSMDAVLLKLPENQQILFELQGILDTQSDGQPLLTETRLRLLTLSGRLAANNTALNRNLNVAAQNTTTAEIEILISAFEDYQTEINAVVDGMSVFATDADAPESVIVDLKARLETAREANNTFYNSASVGLQTGVSARINALVLQFYVIALVALASVAGAFLLGQSIMASISQPLFQLAETSQKIAFGDLSARVPIETTDELGKVASAFNEMARELENEKAALLSRTRELEAANLISTQRAQDMQAISEISRAIAVELKLDALLPLVANLVSEKFSFYHIGIFLLDEPGEYAILQASNSEGGKRMLKRAHRLRVGSGLVGFSAATSQPRIALDVGTDAVFFNNPDLPKTRSEMALPLRVSGNTIGVLDVQSTEPNAFGEEDITTLSTLADQVAIAIQNSRNFETAQRFIEHAQRTTGLVLQESWETITAQSQLNTHSNTRAETGIAPEIFKQMMRDRKPVIVPGKHPRVAVPIQLSDRIVGAIQVQLPESHSLDPDEVDIAQAVGDRLSLALESTTLLEAAQRRAEFERMTSEISTRIGASTRFESILRTAAEELSRALGGSDVVVQIRPPQAGSNGTGGA
jgi:GAF domain-containing protein/HAMP domain-containing protein